MNERQSFLQALAVNEDDTTIRLVFADWLDEHGEPDEAQRQRLWPAAKQWLIQLCRNHCGFQPQIVDEESPDDGPNEDNPYSFLRITYKQLLELGRQAVQRADEQSIVFDCGANEDLCDELRSKGWEFWNNWSIVTGIALPPGLEGKTFFGCGC